MSKILVVKEKHGELYYDASTNELLDKACKEILKARLEQGYYDPYGKIEGLAEPLSTEGIADKRALAAIEKENKAIEERNEGVRQNNRYVRDEISYYRDVIKCLSMEGQWLTRKQVPASFFLLSLRRGYEYEGIELIDLSEPEEIDMEPFAKKLASIQQGGDLC